ncbi:hypothetical protein CR513_54345, partial [Mucuna pruriens]
MFKLQFLTLFQNKTTMSLCKTITFEISSNYLKDYKSNIERYKARLVAKGFTRNEGNNYKETFSPDSFKTIMALVVHFDLELHHMDVKTAFLNGNIDKTIYMVQPENFVLNESKFMICKLKKFIYGLKQASLITSYGFEANIVDDCVYHKLSGSKYIFLVLYVDDILLVSSDTCLLHETKRFLTKNFEMKNLREASFVLGIKILRYYSQGILRLAPNNDLERNEIQKISYASTVGSLMYAQVCTRPDIAFVVGVLGRYLNNLAVTHVMRYLKRTKAYMLTYRKSKGLEIIRYSDSDLLDVKIANAPSEYICMLAGGAISWKFVKQTLIAPSIIVVEFVACFVVVNGIERPLKIYCDYNSTVFYSNNNRNSTKLKFINIKFLVVKERVQKHRTRFMLADQLTKGLIPKVFHEHNAHMG